MGNFIKTAAEFIGRCWFLCCLLTATLTGLAMVWVSSLFPGDEVAKRNRARWICQKTLRCMWLSLCPWIRVVSAPTEDEWDSVLGRDRVLLLMNRRSPIESFFLLAMCPLRIQQGMRSLFQAHRTPLILRNVSQALGHFLVGNLDVEDEKTQEVLEDMKTHVMQGGRLMYFPEGRFKGMDDANSKQLPPFLPAAFALALRMDMRIVSLTIVGTDVCWRPGTAVGGYPAELKLKLSAIREMTGAAQPYTSADAEALAQLAHKSMQKDLDALLIESNSINSDDDYMRPHNKGSKAH